MFSIAGTCCSYLEHSSMCPQTHQAVGSSSLGLLYFVCEPSLDCVAALADSHLWTWAAKLLHIDLYILDAYDGVVFIGNNKCLSEGNWICSFTYLFSNTFIYTLNILYVGNRVGTILDHGNTVVTRTNAAFALISHTIQKKNRLWYISLQ